MGIDLALFRGLPLGLRSDLEVLARTGSTVADLGDHLVVRTPDNPGYHWGNLLVVTDERKVGEARRWLTRFRAELPDAAHVSIALPARPDPPVWADVGLTVEREEALAAVSPPRARAVPAGYELRRLLRAHDWACAVALEIDQESYAPDPAGFRRFAAARWWSRRRLSDAGGAAFFGAFRDGRQVAQLGIVACADHARYQSVLTHAEHRGHGLASALLATAGAWAQDQGATRWVIVADPATPAARLYRAAGFAPVVDSWQAYRT